MRPLRIVLFAIAVICLGAGFVVATRDVFVGKSNCGAALWARDTNNVTQQTGDLADDDFAAEVLRKQCSRDLFRQRVAMIAILGAGIGLLVIAIRMRDPEERFPGDPIV